MFARAKLHTSVITAKRLWYGGRGEPITYGKHRLRYEPGTRPVRLKYVESEDAVVRNDARQIQFFVERVKSGDFVLDIGGNFGQYAVLFCSLVGESGLVATFEPDSHHRQVLLRNLELNGFSERAIVEGLALSDVNGSHVFFSRNDSMSSLVKSGLGDNANLPDIAEFTVETIRVDDYLDRNQLPAPAWAKIDTEGAEINILRGALRLLRSNTKIVCELHPYAWAEFGTDFAELKALVEGAGRTMQYLDPAFEIHKGPLHGSVVIS